MLSRPEPACLVIADISGYTGYLAGVELDHAQDILADLMSMVVTALRPTFRLAKLEGDAAFSYAMTDTVDATQLMDTVERTYFAFRRRMRDIAQASTCECNACIRIPALNLKLIAHHGLVGRQRIAGREELVGSEVIVVHRLLKNEVETALGLKAYAVYTEACVAAMGLADPALAGLVRHHETYDVIGDVDVWVRDLEAAWQQEQEKARTRVDPATAIFRLEALMPGPPEIVWDWLTSPARRPKWQQGVTEIRVDTASGRRGSGTTNHCMHGRDAIVEEIVDWRPFDYFTIRFQMPMPAIPKLLMSDLLEPAPGGTQVTVLVGRPRTAKDLRALETIGPMLEATLRANLGPLAELIAKDVADRAAAAAEVPEPSLPPGESRFLEPVATSA